MPQMLSKSDVPADDAARGQSASPSGGRPPLAVVLLALLSLGLAVFVLVAAVLLFFAPHSAALRWCMYWVVRLGFIPMHGRIGSGRLPTHGVVIASLLVYMVVFLFEGCGMLLGKAWAEYLVLVELLLLLPPEAVENYRHTDWLRLATLVFNAAIFVYLAVRRGREWMDKPGRRRSGAPGKV